MGELKRYFSYIGKYKTVYWIIFVITIVSSAMIEVLYSYMNKLVFNSVEYGNQRMFTAAVLLCIGLVVISCLFTYLRYFQIRIVRKIVFGIKIELFHKLMKMNMDYYEKHHSGGTLKTLSWDADSLKDSYFSHVYWVISNGVNGITAVTAMMMYSPELALISIAFSIISVRISIKVNEEIKKMEKGIQGGISRLAERLSDILSGFVLLKMYRGSSIVLENYQRENEKVFHEEKKRTRKSASLEMISFFMGILGSFGTIIAGAVLAAHKELDYGTIMAVVSLQMSVSGMVQRFGFSMTTFSSSLVKAGRVFDFLELDLGEEEENFRAVDMDNIEDAMNEEEKPLKIEGLTFSYDGENKVLDGFCLEAEMGEKILLTGESGCGKSTLLKLLMRFYEKSSGTIKLYGRDICEYPVSTLRNYITYVPQNNYLFEGSIKENIAYGNNNRKDITDEEIKKAAVLAYADEFIRELPKGYDTHLTAGGSSLSGGQRQRIAIARAFLKDSPILLLDEPSSALDVQSEKMINLAMKQLMQNRIVIMVTHRTTSFAEFDRVVEME